MDDYSPNSGSVVFSAGQGPGATQNFTFTIVDDILVESSQIFGVTGSVSAVFRAQFSNRLTSDAVGVIIVDNNGNFVCLSKVG